MVSPQLFFDRHPAEPGATARIFGWNHDHKRFPTRRIHMRRQRLAFLPANHYMPRTRPLRRWTLSSPDPHRLRRDSPGARPGPGRSQSARRLTLARLREPRPPRSTGHSAIHAAPRFMVETPTSWPAAPSAAARDPGRGTWAAPRPGAHSVGPGPALGGPGPSSWHATGPSRPPPSRGPGLGQSRPRPSKWLDVIVVGNDMSTRSALPSWL